MIEPWVIEEIRRRKRELDEQPVIQIPVPEAPRPPKKEPEPKPGVVIIEL